MKFFLALGFLAVAIFFLGTSSAQAPVETCGTAVPKAQAELKALACPEGFVGQWFQERAAGSCEWAPSEPQWYACAIEIEPQGTPPADDVPVL